MLGKEKRGIYSGHQLRGGFFVDPLRHTSEDFCFRFQTVGLVIFGRASFKVDSRSQVWRHLRRSSATESRLQKHDGMEPQATCAHLEQESHNQSGRFVVSRN